MVAVKEIQTQDLSTKEKNRTKQEVIHKATVLAALGDHPGIRHLFGVCIKCAPYYLVLQRHAVEGRSITLTKATSTRMIANADKCIAILKETCETLTLLHSRGYLHHDLKGNNVI